MDRQFKKANQIIIASIAIFGLGLSACVQQDQDPTTGQPFESTDSEIVECKSHCKQNAIKIYKACVKSTGDKATCYASSSDWMQACVSNWCAPPPTCEDACQDIADYKFDKCQHRSNTDPVECSDLADRKYGLCLESRCGYESEDGTGDVQEPIECIGDGCAEDGDVICRGDDCDVEDEPTCEDECRDNGADIYNSCVNSGEEKATCQQKASTYTNDCFTRC
jgi:hypothetical protein